VDPVAFGYAVEDPPRRDTRRVQPCLDGFDGTEPITPGDRHLLALAGLIRLRPPYEHPEAIRGLGQNPRRVARPPRIPGRRQRTQRRATLCPSCRSCLDHLAGGHLRPGHLVTADDRGRRRPIVDAFLPPVREVDKVCADESAPRGFTNDAMFIAPRCPTPFMPVARLI
jgi:hypothetical protein